MHIPYTEKSQNQQKWRYTQSTGGNNDRIQTGITPKANELRKQPKGGKVTTINLKSQSHPANYSVRIWVLFCRN